MTAEKIEITLNGEPFTIEIDCTVENLLMQISKNKNTSGSSSQNHGAVAVELNSEIVPRDQFAQTKLKRDDTVEVVTLVGGG